MIKINEEEFIRVCRLAGLVEVIKSKSHAFKTVAEKEGIELVDGKIQTFCIITMDDGTKEKAISNMVDSTQIRSVIGAFEKEINGIEEKKEPKKNEIQRSTPIMPDTLTEELYTKWEALTIPRRLIMLQNTSKHNIQERKGRGGNYKYVDISYMIKCANMAFSFQWDSTVTGWEKTDKEIICFGTVEASFDGKRIKKSACGQKDIAFTKGTNNPVCLGDDYKAAQSDMIKKAISQFGIAQDIYGGENVTM